MTTLIIYSIKASVAIGFFYILHMLFFKNITHFKMRRVYFLFALLFSLLFPFIMLEWGNGLSQMLQIPSNLLSEIVIYAEQRNATAMAVENGRATFNFFSILIPLVSVGIIFLLGRLMIQGFGLYKLLQNGEEFSKANNKNVIEIENASFGSFSFFHWIIINKKDKTDAQLTDILHHEIAHAEGYHSLDVLLYEVCCIFFWWNPFIWMMKNEMKLNLEFLADNKVLANKKSFRDYQYTLLQISIANTGVAFINNFNVSHLKKRIMMMNKKRSPAFSLAKYLLILPMIGLLVYCNSDNGSMADEKKEITTKSEQPSNESTRALDSPYTVVEKMPTFPGGEKAMMNFIGQNIKYPEKAQKDQVEGKVVIRFIVSEAGKISQAEIIKGISTECDEESLRVVNTMPDWTPGEQDGKKVSVFFTLPILYKLR